MKTVITATSIALVMGFSLPGIAANDHAGHGTVQGDKATNAKLSEGVVKKVDKSGGKVTVAHGPLHNLNMGAMTMVFRVKEASWLDKVKDGDKIRFIADKVDRAYTIVHFEAAK